MENVQISKKIKARLKSEKMHRGFDTMIRIYCGPMTKSQRNIFADLLVKQMNGGYNIAIHENSLKYKLKTLRNRVKCFFGYHDWDNVGNHNPPPPIGGTVCWSSLHECSRCKKEEMKGMGCISG